MNYVGNGGVGGDCRVRLKVELHCPEMQISLNFLFVQEVLRVVQTHGF